MTASGVGSLMGGLSLSSAAGPGRMRIALGAIVLGVASVLLAVSTSFPLSLLLMVIVGRRHRDGGHRQHDDPARGPGRAPRPGDERLHHGLLPVPIGGLLDGRPGASAAGVPVAIAIGGDPVAAVGLGALVWWRRRSRSSREPIRGDATAACPGARRPRAGRAGSGARRPQPSTEPSTSAAFSPPNPNEVDSTRR